ncbi:hypothetical protein [Sphingomonas sp.]|uniref:DUF6975 family protein n=1 Tax=Sphingomonas sp. TaxID=28214 RepID=UPI001EC7EEFE|nr:hypothetical protein [Sphingomonas sp.]MBX3595548.1 hypothetical protein [Sphingomonas sp.]
MTLESAQTSGLGGASGTLAALVAADGSAGHPFHARLLRGTASMRDLADVVHQLCILHARHPDVIEQALGHSTQPASAAWLAVAATGFAAERAHIVRLVAAVGPLPSTPGQAASEAAVAGQRHALDMLAQSDRGGCADGMALALALDWPAIRQVMDVIADRLGLDLPGLAIPPRFETATIVDAIAERLLVERAMLFGAQQMLAQHRGLWDLLEARASARDDN